MGAQRLERFGLTAAWERHRARKALDRKPDVRATPTRPEGVSKKDWKAEQKRLAAERADAARFEGKAGTPETLRKAARTQQGALARLYAAGAIDVHQLTAAQEIEAIHARIGADVRVSIASLEARVDGGRHGRQEEERLGEVRRQVAYTRWRDAVARMPGAPIAAVLDMIVGDRVGFSVAATRHGMHHRRAKRLLIEALDLWWTVHGQVRREVDERDLRRAHAALG